MDEQHKPRKVTDDQLKAVMKKRYRAPKVIEGQIKMQRGKVDGAVDMCVFYGDDTPRCDRALVMNTLCCEWLNWKSESVPSFIDELERRGYDLDTLRFSIEKKIDK
jgi:hypothetical protein